ncbi:MAG: V-type ATP synthase subunit B [Defluviitaleaceae bacterium]|nr:V-type ATP synthase subunit B [Defluviitaleaceae bacterium]
MEHFGINEIRGSLITIKNVSCAFDEIVTIKKKSEPPRMGRVIQIVGDTAVILVFEGTSGLTLEQTSVKFTGKLLETKLSEDMLGQEFDGLGRPRRGASHFWKKKREIDGQALNPATRIYPRNYIHTGFSAIDCLLTLIRGQKLPIFSADGLPHNRLAVDIATRAKIAPDEKFAVVFAAMGIGHETANFFRREFVESGQSERTIMFLNMADEPPAERIVTPRFALTAAEFLAYEKGYHVLVILTDMSAYAEALREISSTRGEFPGRKGFPAYMYSDLASIYERAGIRKGKQGSITQIPILTMPAEDITHPIPDLTGYITEGQIVLERGLHNKGIFPPINVLPSLSRLAKDGIGENFTTKEHPLLAAKLFAAYAEAVDVRSLASVIGEDDLTERDRAMLRFGERFEWGFLNQGGGGGRGGSQGRDMGETLGIAEGLLEGVEYGDLI